MAATYRNFLIELYLEHLEESGFQYELRKTLFFDPEVSWQRIEDVEKRMEAHIDALIIGGKLALDVCRQRLTSAEPGEWFVAVCVFCRHRDAKLLGDVWRQLDFADAAKVSAVTDALKLDMPVAWQPACEQAIARGDERLLPILSMVCAARGSPLSEAIAARLLAAPQLVTAQAIWALSRLSPTASTAKILATCGDRTADVKAAALLAILRAGQREVVRGCYPLVAAEEWPQIAMGLAGDRKAAAALQQRLRSGSGTRDTLYALGLLGDPSSVRALCDCLSNEALADSASWALYWITGAELFEDVFVPEPVDENTLFPHELAAWRERGEMPKRSDGKPFGVTVRQLTRDASIWNRWLTEHMAAFDANRRYRRGQLYSLRAVYQCLVDPDIPHRWRELSCEELVVRFRCPIAIEVDWRVAEQRRAFAQIADWIQQSESQFVSGDW
jgi:uncharacterized protein (TIGR02270 family)